MHAHWFSPFGVPFTLVVAYVPLVATVVTTVLSIILARATLRYAEASDRSLALAREEFDRQWSPELHVKLEKVSSREARIFVTNLARISVLLQMVQLRKLSMAVPSLRFFLNEPLVGGTTWTDDLGKRLVLCTGDNFEGQIAASVTFYASGRMFRTDWFRFQLETRRGELIKLDPMHIVARPVRMIERSGGGLPVRRELVMDVAQDASAKEEKVSR
jgi:hypothetical protein